SHPSPPTRPYPLSLHDALPIYTITTCGRQRLGSIRVLGSKIIHPDLATTYHHEFSTPWVDHTGQVIVSPYGLTAKALVAIRVKIDRKSTRLNSSHEWISYAVFC